MTAKLSFCVKAATSLDDQDLATITQSIEHYQRAGMSAEQAESAAVGDMIAAVTAERGDMVKTLRTQHPDLFLSSRPPLPEPKKALARVQPIRGSMALGQISVQLDGLSPDLLPDLSSKVERTRVGKTGKRSQYTTWDNPPQPGVGPLFRKGGTADLSEVARVLDEEGYMEPGLSESDPLEAIKKAQAIIKAELAKGGATVRIGAPEEVEAEMQRRQDMANELPDDVFDGIDDDAFDQSGYADLPPEVKALTEQLLAQAEAAGLDTETMRERAAMGDPTDADYHAQLDALLTEALASAAAGAEEHDASAAPGGREGGRQSAQGEEPGAGPASRDAGRAEPGGLTYGGTVQEPGASYTTDLFGTDLEGAGATQLPTQRAAAPTPAPAPTATPATGALNDTPAPEGNYQARTIVGSEIQRTLGAARITTPAEAAAATQYLYRNAVERFDGIVVDKNGKPLAVVGGFKGALAQASVYQATVMGEAIRVPGAAAIWFSHNHPSGSAQLSNADKQLNGALAKMFRGSGIESKGLLAIGDGRYHYVDEKGKEAAPWTITKLTTTSKVPVIERQLGGTKEATVGLTSPLQAKAMAKKLYEAGGDRPGLVLLDSQLNVVAWVPLPEVTQGKLRGTGGLNAIYRAVSEANAGGAMIVHGGELDVKVNGPVTAAHNIAAALRDVDVRTIDVVNAKTNTSDAEGAGVRAPSEAFSLANEDIRTDFQDTQQLERPEVTEGTPAQQDVDAIAKLEGNFKRKVEAFQSLKLTALPRRAEPAKNASQAERERYAAADMAEKLFGKRVVFFSSNIAFANGVMADYLPGMIFVNEATTRPIMAVLGHELLHSMRQSHPELYRKLYDRLTGLLENPGRYGELLNARRAARGLPPLSFDKLREELIADIVGDNFTDPAFWRQMTAGQPTLFGRVLRVIRDFLDDLLAKLRNERPYGTNQYLNDVQGARDAVVEAMRAFGNDPKTAAAAVVTAAEADLSATNDPFYSELSRQVETAKMASAPAQGWKDWLKGLTNKGTIKADEIAWTGIEDWLDLQASLGGKSFEADLVADGRMLSPAEKKRIAENPGKVSGKITRDQVVDFLAGNGVKVTETQSPTGESIGTQDFRTWQLPGGSNYREVLLTLPSDINKTPAQLTKEMFPSHTGGFYDLTTAQQQQVVDRQQKTAYKSGHWDQMNVLAHIRLNDRTDAEGKRVLFVEEIQSDWAQEGKKKGFTPVGQQPVDPAAVRQAAVDALARNDNLGFDTARQAMGAIIQHADWASRFDVPDAADRAAIQSHREAVEAGTNGAASKGIPSAPFVGKTDAWVSLAIKRVIKMAVDEGYDRVAFVSGEQSAERYDLSKQVESIRVVGRTDARTGEKTRAVTVELNEGGTSTFGVDAKGIVDNVSGTNPMRDAKGKSLADVIGKEMADRVMQADTGTLRGGVEFRGDGLKVGGEGMKAFYDQIVPKVAKDVVKKLGGGALTQTTIDTQGRSEDNNGLREVREWSGPEVTYEDVTIALQHDHPSAIEQQLREIRDRIRDGVPHDQAIREWGSIAAARALGGDLVAKPTHMTGQTGFDITPSMREKAAGGLPMFSLQHTPEEEAALAKAGINTRTRLQRAGDRIRQHYTTAQNALRSDWAAGFQQGALDQFTGINRAIKREIGALPRDQDPYVAARLANGGTSSVMRGLMLHGQARWAANGQHLEKIPDTEGLLDILKPLGPRLNDFFGWMIGNRAERLMKEGRENNFTADDIKALKGLNKGMESEFRAAALKYAAFKRTVLDVAEQAGLLDPESRKVWDNADYIPFYREIDEKAVFGATGKKGLAGQSSGIRTLKGGEAALNDPMENILMNFSRLVDASLKNRALRSTIDVLTAAKSDIVDKVGYDMAKQVVPANQVRKQLEAAGTPQQILDIIPPEAFEGMAKMWAIQAPTDPDVVRVMRNGKPEFYKVSDPLLLKALTSFVPFDFPGLGVARAFKRVLTGMVTVTPDFMLRNWIRDTAATAIITRDGFSPIKSLSGVVKSYREAGAFEDLLFAGASFQSGHINAADPVQTGKAMRRALREKGFDASSTSAFIGSILDTPMRFFEKYKHVGESIENGNREAVYEAARTAGKSPTAAAFESKDLMDFSLRGSNPFYQLLADVLPFFNARVQGLYRLGRADPKRVALYGTLMMVATLALAYANGDNDDYDKLPDWDKETYWHFWIKGEHFRMPKPFELGAVFASIPERIMRYAMGQDTGKKSMSRLWAIVRDQLAFDPVPQLIRPVMNTWANKDTFRDRPIENQGDEGKLPSMRYSKVTSPTAVTAVKAIAPVADEIGLSPKKLEYLVGGYLGTAGLYALGLSDMAVSKLRGDPVKPATRLDQLPIIGSFYRQEPATSTVYETDLYKMRTEVEQIYKSVRALKKDDKDDEAEALAAKHEKELDARKTLERGAKKLTSLNKQRDEIYADRTMTREEKRKAIDELLRDRAEISKDTMKSEEVINAQ